MPDMPGQIPRVYPSSGGVAMLPLTPANNYTPTILFCGGTYMEDFAWGNYSWPFVNTWEIAASKDCQRITPEPTDGSSPEYIQDDDLITGRTMGQFIILPDGNLFYVNGGANGTAGYATQTLVTLTYGEMPFGMSLAADPVLTPAIYSPNKPAGSRWSNEGLGASTIPRLYHSSAILLPDASVMIAGSNPNVDYNGSATYSTEYRAEKFYPWYWSETRPVPQGMPTTLGYGGSSFDVSFGKESYSGSPNDAAANSSVVVIRGGFTTHASTSNASSSYKLIHKTNNLSSEHGTALHAAQQHLHRLRQWHHHPSCLTNVPERELVPARSRPHIPRRCWSALEWYNDQNWNGRLRSSTHQCCCCTSSFSEYHCQRQRWW